MLSTAAQKTLHRLFCSCVHEPNDSLHYDDGYVTTPTRIGNYILFYGRRKSQFPSHCLLGPDWPFVIVVFALIFLINAIILYIISPLGWPPVLIGIVGALVLLGAYSVVAFSDPGIVYRDEYGSPPDHNHALLNTANNIQSTTTVSASASANLQAITPLAANTNNVTIGSGSSSSNSDITNSHEHTNNNNSSSSGSNRSSSKNQDLLSPNSVAPPRAALYEDMELGGQERLLSPEETSSPHAQMLPLTSSTHANATANITMNNHNYFSHDHSHSHSATAATPHLLPAAAHQAARVSFALERTIECGNCQLQRPMTARHCSYCRVCVRELDHHCPWSGKCIGERNLKAFHLFVQMLCVQFYYLLGCLIYFLIYHFLSRSLPHGPSF